MIKHLDNYYHYYSTVSLNISTFIFWLLVKVLVGLVSHFNVEGVQTFGLFDYYYCY